MLPVRSISPSSLARRNGVPWVTGAPKYVSQVSRWASKCTTATGPCTSCITRSSGSAMVWSPPMVISLAPVSTSARAPSSICLTASVMSNGLQAMSPASATCCTANGSMSCTGL